MVNKYFIDYRAADKDDNDIYTDDVILYAANPIEALDKLDAMLSPDHIFTVDYIGLVKGGDCEDVFNRGDYMNYGLVIYAILIGHSDKEHPLKQRDIRQLLREEYGYNVDRETVRRAIEDMQIYDLPIKCSLQNRSGTDFYMTDIYYDKEH